MTSVDHNQAVETPPEAFVRMVKEALESLYDLPALQRNRLALDPAVAGRPGESGGQRLRSELLAAIENLNPGPATPFRAPHARTFHVLHLHYVEGMTIGETARELGLSERQAYRDLRQADATVATLMWSQRRAAAAEHAEAARGTPARSANSGGDSVSPTVDATLSLVEAEMDCLAPKSETVDLGQLLGRVQQAVERLAGQYGVALVSAIPADPVFTSADPVLARQILTHLLSQAIQAAQPGELHLGLTVWYDGATVRFRYRPRAGQASPSETTVTVTPAVALLAARLRWEIEQGNEAVGHHTMTVNTGRCGPSVLIIDDNQGIVELVGRYLSGLACRVWTATRGTAGLELAQQIVPDAIILDVMMPDMDGWEFLQRLHSIPSTSAVPVIICSVFSDPELAFSLGASAVLSKPVKQADILDTLCQLKIL